MTRNLYCWDLWWLRFPLDPEHLQLSHLFRGYSWILRCTEWWAGITGFRLHANARMSSIVAKVSIFTYYNSKWIGSGMDSTQKNNQVSIKWNVIFLTLTKLNKFRVQILGPFSQEFYKKKLSKSDFTHFFACLTFCRKMHLLLFHCTTCKLDLQSLLCNCLFHLKKDILKRHFSTL